MARFSVMADRYVYLASIGLFYILVRSTSIFIKNSKSMLLKKVVEFSLLAYLLFNISKTAYYIIEWSNYWADKIQ